MVWVKYGDEWEKAKVLESRLDENKTTWHLVQLVDDPRVIMEVKSEFIICF